MIITGSFALALHGLRSIDDSRDLDLVGTREEADALATWLGERVTSISHPYDNYRTLHLKPGYRWTKIEIDDGQSTSDRLLDPLCRQQVRMFDRALNVPPLEVLYLIKRAHATVPIHQDKTLRDLLLLKRLIGPFSEEQRRFGQQRETECVQRYARHRSRFIPAISDEDLIYPDTQAKLFERADIRSAILGEDSALPALDVLRPDTHAMPDALPTAQQLPPWPTSTLLQMARTEFMVTGIERFHWRDPSLPADEVYRLGMRKTLRDLFSGSLQNFCIDHLELLVQPPAENFVDRFTAAVAAGRVRERSPSPRSIDTAHEHLWTLIQQGQHEEARRLAEDRVRRSDGQGDPYAYFLLGAVLNITGHLAQAERCLRAHLAWDQSNHLAWLHLGMVMLKTDRKDEGLRALDTAHALKPDDFSTLLALGMAYDNLGKPEEAAHAYRQANAIHPDHPQIRERLQSLARGP